MNYPAFVKIPRFNTDWTMTEKIDGTNGLIYIANEIEAHFSDMVPPVAVVDGVYIWAGSRKRWITPENDNFGFAKWVKDNAHGLAELGPGHHYGEWYGSGIQRGYGLDHKRFMLFNTHRWGEGLPEGLPDNVEISTVLTECPGSELNLEVEVYTHALQGMGSYHVPGFERPEGLVLYNRTGNALFKVVFDKPESKNPNDVGKLDFAAVQERYQVATT